MQVLPLGTAERLLSISAAALLGGSVIWLELTLVRLYSYLYPAWLVYPLLTIVFSGIGLGGFLVGRMS